MPTAMTSIHIYAKKKQDEGVNFRLAPTPNIVQTFHIDVFLGPDYGKKNQSWRK